MKKNGFTVVEMLIVVVMLAILAMIVIPQFTGGLKPESAGEQKGLIYRIAVLGDDEVWYPYNPHQVQFYPDHVEFYIEGLIKNPNTGYVSCLAKAKRKIEVDGYDVTMIIPTTYKWSGDELCAIWVIAERK